MLHMDAHSWRDLMQPAKALWDVNPDCSSLELETKRMH